MPFTNGPVTTGSAGASDDSGSGWSLGGAALGGAALIGGGMLASRAGVLGKILKGLNAARMQSLLSGFAIPKSVLGNVGAAVEKSIEHGTAKPISELLSMETLRDFGKAYKGHFQVGPTPGVNLPGPMPGRIMGAMDTATNRALQRAGIGADEAENALLQTPLGKNFGKFGETLEGPVTSYLHPFRRNPFNQFIEGAKAMNRVASSSGTAGERLATKAYGVAGAVHGAATADDDMPLSVPMMIAMSGRQGAPYGLAALAARRLMGSKTNGGVPGAVLPVSEYGLDQSISDPLKPFYKPAALAALERITG